MERGAALSGGMLVAIILLASTLASASLWTGDASAPAGAAGDAKAAEAAGQVAEAARTAAGDAGGYDAEPALPGDLPAIPVSDCSLTPEHSGAPTFGPVGRADGSRVLGTKDMIMIGGNFTDTTQHYTHDDAYYESMITDMDDYYQENSYGTLSLSGDWGGWHQVPNTYAFYGAYSGNQHDVNIAQFILNAVDAANPSVDFSQYDNNGDGYIEYLIVVHAGSDQAITHDANDIWSHRGQLPSEPLVDGKRIRYYVTVSEDDALGTFVHEFGHHFGLPDLYDTDYSSDGIGKWGLMASGPHLNNGNTPAHFCAWSKVFLGWVDPVEVTENLMDQVIMPAEDNAEVYRLSISTKEYFLIENRQNTGYDLYLPGNGLLIWHIDDNVGTIAYNNVQNQEGHKRVDLEENGAKQHLDLGPADSDYNDGDSGDPWTSTPEGEGFNSHSAPDSNSYSGMLTEIAVEGISGGVGPKTMVADLIIIGRAITFDLKGGGDGTASVDPGRFAEFAFDITSNRDGGDTVYITAEGSNTGWVSYPDGPVNVTDEADEATARVRIRAPATALPGASCIVDVHAYSLDETVSTTEHLEVSVNTYRAVGFNNSDVTSLKPDSFALVEVRVENRGNVQDTFAVTSSIPSPWSVETDKTSLVIPAFDSKTVDVSIFSPEEIESGLFATATVTATPQGGGPANSTYVTAYVDQVHGVSAHNTTPTMGSGPGGEADHVVRVRNEGNGADTFTLSTVGVPQHLVVTLDATEVYLQPYVSADITVTVEIAEGSAADDSGAMFGVKVLSSDGVSDALVYLITTVEPVYSMEVTEPDEDRVAFLPDAQALFTVNVTNTGNINDTFDFSLGRHSQFIEVDLSDETLELGAGETGALVLTVTSDPNAPADDYDFSVKVESRTGEEDEKVELTAVLDTVHAATVSVESLDPPGGIPQGSRATYSVTVTNTGNDADTVTLQMTDTSCCQATFEKDTVSLGKGKTLEVRLTVQVAPGAEPQKVEAAVYGVLGDGSETGRASITFSIIKAKADDGGDDGGDIMGGDSADLGGDDGGGMVLIAVALAAAVAVAAVVIFIFMRKKGDSSAAKAWQKGPGEAGNGETAPSGVSLRPGTAGVASPPGTAGEGGPGDGDRTPVPTGASSTEPPAAGGEEDVLPSGGRPSLPPGKAAPVARGGPAGGKDA